jgi:hypothetical protein
VARKSPTRFAGATMVAGIVLAMAPLFGVIAAVTMMLAAYQREYGALVLNAASMRNMRLPLRPILAGFTACPAGLLLIALATRSFSARLKRDRAPEGGEA